MWRWERGREGGNRKERRKEKSGKEKGRKRERKGRMGGKEGEWREGVGSKGGRKEGRPVGPQDNRVVRGQSQEVSPVSDLPGAN